MFKVKSADSLVAMMRKNWSSWCGFTTGSKVQKFHDWNEHKANFFMGSHLHFSSLDINDITMAIFIHIFMIFILKTIKLCYKKLKNIPVYWRDNQHKISIYPFYNSCVKLELSFIFHGSGSVKWYNNLAVYIKLHKHTYSYHVSRQFYT